MIQQLVTRLIAGTAAMPAIDPLLAARMVLTADPLDLVFHMEDVWYSFRPALPAPPLPVSAREKLIASGQFTAYRPGPGAPDWDHLGYSYVLENSRAIQIFRRVVREYRSGEGVGIPSPETEKWLDATEALLFGAANPLAAWLSTSTVRSDPESVRRNAYWRLFGLDLAFGSDDNRPPVYDKAQAANTTFVQLFEELLYELWQAIANLRNSSGVNASDDDRIFRLAESLQFILRSRRQVHALAREELAAATALGWIELTLSTNTFVVLDLKAEATSPADRLRLIGERVGLAPHTKSSALFSMASELSILLRIIESGLVSGQQFAWLLYDNRPRAGEAAPIGDASRRVITEWAAATGKDLKARGKAVEVARPRLVAVQ